MVYRDPTYYDSEGYAIPRRTPAPRPLSPNRPSYTSYNKRYDLFLVAKAKARAQTSKENHYLKQAGASFYLGSDKEKKQTYSFTEERGRPRSRVKKKDNGLGFLDTPYVYVTEKGGSLVESLSEKSLEYKKEGKHGRGLALAIGASAAAAGTGALAAVTGLVSPKAWRDTIDAITHPKKTAKTIAKNPLSWSYLAGSIILPTKTFKAAGKRLATIREPDPAFAEVKYSSIEGKALYNYPKEGEVRWIVRGEETGITREVGKGIVESPKKRTVSILRSDKSIIMSEERSGWIRPKVTRKYAVFESSGKETFAREVYEFNWRGTKYRYRVEIYDPLKVELVDRARGGRAFDFSFFEKPPRITTNPPLGAMGAVVGAGIGLGGASRLGGSGSKSHNIILNKGKSGATTLVLPGAGSSAGSPLETVTSKSKSKQLYQSRALVNSRSLISLPAFDNKWFTSKRPRRKRKYSEILYPSLKLEF